MCEHIEKDERKLTDEEIVKAVENNFGFGAEHTGINRICSATLDLIHRLQEKNERLTEEKWQVQDDLDNYHEINKELEKRNAELQKQVDELKLDLENWKKSAYGYKYAEEQAVKDTAKEICDLILEHWEKKQLVECDWLRVAISEKYGVEVE